MDEQKLREAWLEEEQAAFEGWDFSRLDSRVLSDPLPWDYGQIVASQLQPHHRLLDMGTGGGEFLLSLGHPPRLTSVTEGWPPNLALCRQRLSPLGIRVEAVAEDDRLPFPDASFDLILNRHESFDPAEVFRCLRPGGRFITQQVGGMNGRDLSRLLIPGFEPPYPDHTLARNVESLQIQGFDIIQAQEAFPLLRFLDIGALVYHARQLPWEFPGFSVESSFEQLMACQAELSRQGALSAREHRFLILAARPSEISMP